MSFGLIPDLCVHDIFCLSPLLLREKGITLLLVDLDNTLSPYSEDSPPARVIDWKNSLNASGIDMFMVSNSKRGARAENYARDLGIPFISRAGKPSPRGPLEAMAKMGRSPEETALVGDQIFTDGLSANRAGILSIVVEPLELHNIFFRLRYMVEIPLRLLCKERCK